MSKKLDSLEMDLAEVLNRHGVDSMAKTPDFILAKYIVTCIAALKSVKVEQAAYEKKN